MATPLSSVLASVTGQGLWMGPAQLDCPEDANPRAYTTRFVEWASGDLRSRLQGLAIGCARLCCGYEQADPRLPA